MKTFTIKKVYFLLLGILAVIAIWEAIAFLKDEPVIFPHLTKVFGQCFKILFSKEIIFLGATILRVVIAIIISFLVALILFILYIKSEQAYQFFVPIVTFFRSAPVVIVSIFIFILIGPYVGPFVITGFLVLPLCVEGLIGALDTIDKNITDELKMVNCRFFSSIFLVYIPLIKQSIFTTILQVLGLGLKVMIMGEYICQTKTSLGMTLYRYKSNLDMTSLLAWLVIIVLIVMAFEVVIKMTKKRMLKHC